MMRVRFLRDFRGALTDEQFFKAGDVGEFSAKAARALVDDGRAEAAEDEPGGGDGETGGTGDGETGSGGDGENGSDEGGDEPKRGRGRPRKAA